MALPPPEFRRGDASQKSDHRYAAAAKELARTVQHFAGIETGCRLLDLGSSSGRLLVGIRALGLDVGRYVGVDTDSAAIEWAQENLAGDEVEFVAVGVRNARYNPKGRAPEAPGFLPYADGEFDRVCINSVFTHMELDDVALHLIEVARLLERGGRIYCTAFVEDDVPAWAENPADYGSPWCGPLHCVRMQRQVFEGLVRTAGLEVDRTEHNAGNQSRYGLRKP